ITRAIGGHGDLMLDKLSGRLTPGDRFLLCSDGLFKALPEAEIAGIMATGQGANALVDLAVERGARDNVTAVVVDVPA
ncbi:MAG: serine/threonine-protein phosphatase, partial [Pseudomonadota bacterium]